MKKYLLLLTISQVAFLSNTDAGIENIVKKSTKNVERAVTSKKAQAAIQAKFTDDALLKESDLSVKVSKRSAELKGTVATDLHYERAVSIAASERGVKKVNVDALHVVDSKAPLTDTYITALVKAKLFLHKLIQSFDGESGGFSVLTKDGIVYVEGAVSSKRDEKRIKRIIRSVRPVKELQLITVKQD